MGFSALLVCCAASLCAGVSVSGVVTLSDGAPASGARVFAEMGAQGPLRAGRADASGRFAFDEIPPGPTGVFAIAPGHGFGGQHLDVGAGEDPGTVSIALSPPGVISGTVVNSAGEAVSGARITRVALANNYRVGIPLAKLTAHGFEMPTSGPDGAFTLDQMPQGESVALKVSHASYAQEGVAPAAVGAAGLRVTLHPGVLLRGQVLSRTHQAPVAKAGVLIKNAQPPHDTTLTETDTLGAFDVRLKPGVYLYRAAGAGQQSAGWTRLSVIGDQATSPLTLYVTGVGAIRGTVHDAITGKPIEDVRVSLTSHGNLADIARSGSDGAFFFQAPAGQNTVRIEASPGYLPPESEAVQVAVEEGKTVELPGMWLAPIPRFQIQVIDGEEKPAAGVGIRVLRPEQLGWHATGAGGNAELRVASMPRDGMLLGLAESPGHGGVALFQLARTQTSGARVQLLEPASVRGRVTDESGEGLAGVRVGAVSVLQGLDSPVVLWRTLSDGQGYFTWRGAVPGVPMRCVAQAGEVTGESMSFNCAPGESKDLGSVIVPGGTPGVSLKGEPFPWDTLTHRCGAKASTASGHGQVVVVCGPAELPALSESMTAPLPFLSRLPAVFVVPGAAACPGGVSVYTGAAPGAATTYVLDGSGKVVLETYGLPPLWVLDQAG